MGEEIVVYGVRAANAMHVYDHPGRLLESFGRSPGTGTRGAIACIREADVIAMTGSIGDSARVYTVSDRRLQGTTALTRPAVRAAPGVTAAATEVSMAVVRRERSTDVLVMNKRPHAAALAYTPSASR
ncbi:MAG: hypothetical protein WEE89_11960 [Gemmatimonadota bacterium]